MSCVACHAHRTTQRGFLPRAHHTGKRQSWPKVPSDLSVAPALAEKWKTISAAIENWGKTARLCLILLVVQVPLDGWATWLLHTG